jgi:hypothetical protein
MQPTPLKKYRIPGYPTRLEVLEQPELLERHLPPGWRATAEMASVAAMLLAASGCATTGTLNPTAAAIVAPVFEHGEGRGSTGCVSVAPPVFLSEEDALQVIAEELSQAGINVAKRDAALAGVRIPPREQSLVGEAGNLEVQVREVPGKARTLNVDILDNKHKVAVEYVSQVDYFRLGGVPSRHSVQCYALKEVAGYVAQQVGEQGKGIHFGAFYDPYPRDWKTLKRLMRDDHAAFRKELEEGTRKAAVESKRLLRLQVKDFIDWLKGQGVI